MLLKLNNEAFLGSGEEWVVIKWFLEEDQPERWEDQNTDRVTNNGVGPSPAWGSCLVVFSYMPLAVDLDSFNFPPKWMTLICVVTEGELSSPLIPPQPFLTRGVFLKWEEDGSVSLMTPWWALVTWWNWSQNRTHTHTLTGIHTLSLSHIHTQSHGHTDTHALTRTHTHALTHTQVHTHALAVKHCAFILYPWSLRRHLCLVK